MKKIFISLLIIIGLSMLFLPSFLSFPIGKQWIERAIAKKTHSEISIESIRFSWLGPQRINGLSLLQNNLSITSETITTNLPLWKIPFLFPVTLKTWKHLAGQLEIKNLSVHMKDPSISFSNIDIDLAAQKKGLQIYAKSSHDSFFSFFLEKNTTWQKIKIEGKNLPTTLIEKLLQIFSYPFVSLDLLGQNTNFFLKADWEKDQGPLLLSLQSTNCQFQFDGYRKDNSLFLQKDLNMHITLTEALSRQFLNQVNPLFFTALSSSTPIYLKIPKEHFSSSFLPFKLHELSIDNAYLDMRKIRAKNTDTLALILGIMKLHRFQKISEMDIWCAPTNFSLKNAKLSAGRLDALLDDTFHICTWGTIDLITKKVDMTLGFTAQALYHAFGIKGLQEGFVLTTPMTGRTDQITIDSATAATKIAALIAGQKATKDHFFGKIFGALQQTKEEIPPPNRPFPWEKSPPSPRSFLP